MNRLAPPLNQAGVSGTGEGWRRRATGETGAKRECISTDSLLSTEICTWRGDEIG